jgi:hypothetical protein
VEYGMVAGLIVGNYEKLRIKGAEAKMNFYKWFFHRRKNLLQQHYMYVVQQKTKIIRRNIIIITKIKKQAAEYEDGDESFFEDVMGYNDIKKLIGMSINAYEPVHTLFSGPPTSAKTFFMKCLMIKLKNSCFTDGGNSTKAGMLDYIFDNKPK